MVGSLIYITEVSVEATEMSTVFSCLGIKEILLYEKCCIAGEYNLNPETHDEAMRSTNEHFYFNISISEILK